MKRANHLPVFTSFPARALVAAACLGWPTLLLAQDTNAPDAVRQFASPEAAIKALREAAEAGDRGAVHAIFGPEITNFLTGDPVQDRDNFKGFSRAMAEGCVPAPAGDNEVILDIGTNAWPFPIPLVKLDGQWSFDTEAGGEEIMNRHIGRDELNAIGVCRAYVTAQKEYFSQDRDGSGTHKYAMKFKSTPGRHDGLYWESAGESSPFSALVAEAHAEGYGQHAAGTGPHPFHGYLFRILTGQGGAAPGGKSSYLVDGSLVGGFALVAYPVNWGKSGIMTFIVNQDGKIYQRSFGEKTAAICASMTRYNPDSHWTLVEDQGVLETE